jgi:hypothetical protein
LRAVGCAFLGAATRPRLSLRYRPGDRNQYGHNCQLRYYGGGAGLYNSQAAYLDSLTNTMGQNIAGNIQTDFPGEEVLPPDTTNLVLQLSSDSLHTYYNAWSVADMVQGNMVGYRLPNCGRRLMNVRCLHRL